MSRGEKAVWSVGTSQKRESGSHAAPWAQPLAPERWYAMPGLLPELRYEPVSCGRRPTGRRGSRHRPPRVSTRPMRGARGPRFARFAAAMEADPASQDQLCARSQRRIRPADPAKSGRRIQWLGIGSWALFCAALFVSLLLRPHQGSLELDQSHPRALVSDVRPIADSVPTTRGLLPAHGQNVASTAPATTPDMDAMTADQGTPAGVEADHQ
jgi:hypothetical protein